MLLPIDQLSSCMSLFAPLAYRSAMMRPLYRTRNAAVNPAGVATAASTAARNLVGPISGGGDGPAVGIVGRESWLRERGGERRDEQKQREHCRQTSFM